MMATAAWGRPDVSLITSVFRSERHIRGFAAAALTMVVVGAGGGVSARRYARLFPQARVIAVEPSAAFGDPGLAAELAAANVSTVAADLWGLEGEAASCLGGDAASSVQEARLDELVCRLGVSRVDVLHVEAGGDAPPAPGGAGGILPVVAGADAILMRVRAVWLAAARVPSTPARFPDRVVEGLLRERGFVRLYDSAGEHSAVQFWAREHWLMHDWGRTWVLRQRLRSRVRGMPAVRRGVIAVRTMPECVRRVVRRQVRRLLPPGALRHALVTRYGTLRRPNGVGERRRSDA